MKDRRKEEGGLPDGTQERRQPDEAPIPAADVSAEPEEELPEGDTEARVKALELERDELREKVKRRTAALRRAIKKARAGAPPEESIDPLPEDPPEPQPKPKRNDLGGFLGSIARSMKKK